MSSLKTFEFHRFVESVLKTETQQSFFIANQSHFTEKSPDYPFRNYFYGIGLVYEGERNLRVGVEDFTLRAGDLLVIGPSIIRHWLDDNWDFKQAAIFFTPELFTPPITAQPLVDSPIFRPGIQHVISLSPTDFEFFSQTLISIKSQEQLPNVVAALVMAMITKLEKLIADTQTTTSKSSRKKQIAKEFCSLINTQYLENKEVAFYADKLNITPKYLSEVIKEETGKSPKSLIEQLLMQEAKSLLKQIEMNIKEISYWLGFDDPSYFTKAFKVSEGMTPNEYRAG
jgi:AraC family transcriptional regulator, transcriptional activator of pobA